MIIILDSDACGRLGFISLSITDRFNLLPVCILLPLVEVGTLQSKPVPPLLSVKNVALMTRVRMAFEFGRKEKKTLLVHCQNRLLNKLDYARNANRKVFVSSMSG